MIVDTTILVDLFRGNPQAENFLLKTNNLLISRISLMELVYGAPSKKALNLIKKQIQFLQFQIVEIDDTISQKAAKIFEDLFHMTGIGLIDAFIAATALTSNDSLATHNLKHFQKIKELKLLKPY